MKIHVYKLLVLVAALTLIAIALIWVYKKRDGSRHFDKGVWRSASGVATEYDPNNPRMQMVEDLIKNYLRADMTEAQVMMLLGNPDEVINGGCIWKYYIGAKSGGYLLPGYDYLILQFNITKVLTNVAVRKSG
jgi:hypothetical protein